MRVLRDMHARPFVSLTLAANHARVRAHNTFGENAALAEGKSIRLLPRYQFVVSVTSIRRGSIRLKSCSP
jgi:hypothetical protein